MFLFNKVNLDFAGVIASFICAIHCMAVPLILSLGVANSEHWIHNHTFDVLVIILGVIIASVSLISDYKKHNSLKPLSLIVIGFSFLGLGLKFEHSIYHMIWSVIGSGFVITAHITNWKLGKQLCSIK
jgi:hypothetical protein